MGLKLHKEKNLHIHLINWIYFKKKKKNTLPALYHISSVFSHWMPVLSLCCHHLKCILANQTGSIGLEWADSKMEKGRHYLESWGWAIYDLEDWRMERTRWLSHSEMAEWAMKRSIPLALSFGVKSIHRSSFYLLSLEKCVGTLVFASLHHACVSFKHLFFLLCISPCLFQRCPLIESEVTALREILEEVGVISTWILRGPSLLLVFSAAPCNDDLMALPTWR